MRTARGAVTLLARRAGVLARATVTLGTTVAVLTRATVALAVTRAVEARAALGTVRRGLQGQL